VEDSRSVNGPVSAGRQRVTYLRISLAVLLLLAIMQGISLLALPEYPGSGWVLAAYSAAFGLVLGLALFPPLTIGYLFFAAFLFLGFWTKLMVHLIAGYELIEPVGSFDGSAEAWDRALVVAALGAIGVAIARLLAIVAVVRYSAPPLRSYIAVFMPKRYPSWRGALWTLYVGVVLFLCAANYQFAFYQIGVEPSLVLPASLNVVPAWLISIGLALALTVLVNWELTYRPRRVWPLAAAIILQSLAISLSALSRSIAVFQAVPALVILALHAWSTGHSRRVLGLGAAAALVMIVMAAAVTAVRLKTYPMPWTYNVLSTKNAICTVEAVGPWEALESPHVSESKKSEIRAQIRDEILRQIGSLVVGRWVGLEGALAVTGYPDTGSSLLARGLREDPKLGTASLYQEIAQAHSYQGQSRPGQFTFLTLPGAMAVLAYSGSGLIVLTGMFLLAGTLIALERLAAGMTRNSFFAAVAGFGMANVIAQLNFPYLALVFFAQLLFAAATIGLVQKRL
jgi:hypothetical protein